MQPFKPLRVKQSCIPCRHRKTRCDDQIPCSACTIRGMPQDCVMPTSSTPSTRKRHAGRASTGHGDNEFASSSSSSSSSAAKKVSADGGSHTKKRLIGKTQSAYISRSTQPTSQRDAYYRPSTTNQAHSHSARINGNPSTTSTRAAHPQAAIEISSDGPRCLYVQSDIASQSRNQLPEYQKNLMEEVLSILPCYEDCESLLHYLFQEADFLIFSTSQQYLKPIWSRFVYGGHVTAAEITLLVAHMATAAALLNETPHSLYRLDTPAEELHLGLMNYVWPYIDQRRWKPDLDTGKSSVDLILLIGMILDYTRFSGQRCTGKWPVIRAYYTHLNDHIAFFQADSLFWDTISEFEQEIVRRVIWDIVLCERWGRLVADSKISIPLHSQQLYISQLKPPDEVLSGPFVPSRDGLEGLTDFTSRFKEAKKRLPRVYRIKLAEEKEQTSRWLTLQMKLSEMALDVGDYLSSVTAWKEEVAQLKASINHTPGASDPSSTSSSTSSFARWQESLLHLGIALCKEITDWKASLPLDCREPNAADLDNLLQIRAACMASIINIGLQRLVTAVTFPWLSNMGLENDTETNSRFKSNSIASVLVSKLQTTGFNNAREMVGRIDLLRSLMSCHHAVFFSSWAATAFFRAATTLALPLLGHIKIGEGNVSSVGRSNVLYDRLSALEQGGSNSHQSNGSNNEKATWSALVFPDLYASAHDIIRILDTLPLFNTNPLGVEASKRLRRIARDHDLTLQGYASSPKTDWSGYNNNTPHQDADAAAAASLTNASSTLTPFPLTISSIDGNTPLPIVGGKSMTFDSDAWASTDFTGVLDSLFAQDTAWWDSILGQATDTIEGNKHLTK